MDPIFHAMILIAVVGLLLYLVIRFIPLQEPFDKILIGVAVIGTVLYLLRIFGIWHG